MDIKYLTASLLLLVVLSGSLQADTAGQTLTLSIPKILLVDIEDTPASFEFLPPTQAGDNFSLLDTSKTSHDQPKVAITSNSGANTKLCAKAVLQNGSPLGDANLQLAISNQSGFSSFNTVFSGSSSEQALTTIGNIETGDLPTTAYQLRLTPGIANVNAMAPYGTHSIEVTYTITDSSCL